MQIAERDTRDETDKQKNRGRPTTKRLQKIDKIGVEIGNYKRNENHCEK